MSLTEPKFCADRLQHWDYHWRSGRADRDALPLPYDPKVCRGCPESPRWDPGDCEREEGVATGFLEDASPGLDRPLLRYIPEGGMCCVKCFGGNQYVFRAAARNRADESRDPGTREGADASWRRKPLSSHSENFTRALPVSGYDS